jgi:hypothetical protein
MPSNPEPRAIVVLFVVLPYVVETFMLEPVSLTVKENEPFSGTPVFSVATGWLPVVGVGRTHTTRLPDV